MYRVPSGLCAAIVMSPLPVGQIGCWFMELLESDGLARHISFLEAVVLVLNSFGSAAEGMDWFGPVVVVSMPTTMTRRLTRGPIDQ